MQFYPSTVAGGLGITVQVGQQGRGVYTLEVQAGLKEKTNLLMQIKSCCYLFHIHNGRTVLEQVKSHNCLVTFPLSDVSTS